jgi:hypothetical protein
MFDQFDVSLLDRDYPKSLPIATKIVDIEDEFIAGETIVKLYCCHADGYVTVPGSIALQTSRRRMVTR